MSRLVWSPRALHDLEAIRDFIGLDSPLYCCPWSGWLSLCVNEKPTPVPSCPDFDFVEYRLFDASEWATEYGTAEVLEIIGLDGENTVVDTEVAGDEAFNQVFFHFLRRVLDEAQRAGTIDSTGINATRLTVQLLDSAFEATWNADGTSQPVHDP